MQAYFIRFMDERGQVRRSSPMNCTNDDDAIQKAAMTVYKHAFELWLGDRFVWRFEPLFSSFAY